MGDKAAGSQGGEVGQEENLFVVVERNEARRQSLLFELGRHTVA